MINYFYVENISAGENKLTFNTTSHIEYTNNPNGEWSIFTNSVKIPKGGRIYLRCDNWVNTNNAISCDYEFNVGGDLTTLLSPEGNVLDLTGKDNVFKGLFKLSMVVDASKLILPSTTLSQGCYSDIFLNCTLLIETPSLPATNLANNCYANMFNGCTKLSQTPTLPALVLVNGCYNSMFSGCTSLRKTGLIMAKNIDSSSIFSGCTNLQDITLNSPNTITPSTFSGISSTGILRSPNMTADLKEKLITGGIPSSWSFIENEVSWPVGGSVPIGWPTTFEMSVAAPLIANRIFKTLNDATIYTLDPGRTACQGLILSVVSDPNKDNNGVYQIQFSEGMTEDSPRNGRYILVKVGGDQIIPEMSLKINPYIKGIINEEFSTTDYVEINANNKIDKLYTISTDMLRDGSLELVLDGHF